MPSHHSRCNSCTTLATGCCLVVLCTSTLLSATAASMSTDSDSDSHDLANQLWECPLDMATTLPTAEFSGPLPCDLDANNPCEELQGKVALITGASTGIGYGAASRLAAAGMTVIGTSRQPELYTDKCTYNLPGDKCKPVGWELWQLDVTSDYSVKQLTGRIKEKYGRIDFLLLNAGRNHQGRALYDEASYADGCDYMSPMERIMQTNFLGTVRVLTAALPHLPKQGYGRVLLTSSIAAFVSVGGKLPYPASKVSQAKLHEDWLFDHYEAAYNNIKFTTLYPGLARTDIIRKAVPGCAPDRPLRPDEYEGVEQDVYRTDNPYVTSEQAGEAIYRIAVDPAPAMRYMLNAPGNIDYNKRVVCTHLAQPMERWPRSYGEPVTVAEPIV